MNDYQIWNSAIHQANYYEQSQKKNIYTNKIYLKTPLVMKNRRNILNYNVIETKVQY